MEGCRRVALQAPPDGRAAACTPDCMATSAMPGRSSRAIRSPTTKTSGWPGSEQSGSTLTRPDAVHLGAGRSATTPRGGEPASRPPRPWCGRESARWTRRRATSTPALVHAGHHGAEVDLDAQAARAPGGLVREPVAEVRPAPGRRPRRAAPGRRPGRCAGSCAAAPGGTARRSGRPSPPRSGPPPTTTKVSQPRRASGSVSASASSKAPKMRPRSSSASSMVFIPVAKLANSSWPK